MDISRAQGEETEHEGDEGNEPSRSEVFACDIGRDFEDCAIEKTSASIIVVKDYEALLTDVADVEAAQEDVIVVLDQP